MDRVGITKACVVGFSCLCSAGCETLIGADFGHKHIESECGVHIGTPPAGDEPDLLFAMSYLDFGDRLDEAGALVGARWGIPLEDRGPCVAPADVKWPLVPSEPVDGRVNAVADGAVELNDWLGGIGTMSTAVRGDITSGKRTALLLLRDYNQRTEDDDVSLFIFGATTNVDSGDSEPSGSTLSPHFDGNDVWYAFGDDGGRMYTPISGHGIVSGGELQVYDIDVPFLIDVRELHAKLEAAGSEFRLSGTIAGKSTMQGLFIQAGEQPVLCTDQPLYGGTAEHAGLKQIWCERRDTDTDGDGQCDALSGGFYFEAIRATLGCSLAPPPARCSKDTDPLYDDCER